MGPDPRRRRTFELSVARGFALNAPRPHQIQDCSKFSGSAELSAVLDFLLRISVTGKNRRNYNSRGVQFCLGGQEPHIEA